MDGTVPGLDPFCWCCCCTVGIVKLGMIVGMGLLWIAFSGSFLIVDCLHGAGVKGGGVGSSSASELRHRKKDKSF